ncbi:MAG: hypothetical protein M3O68_09240 [Thermoproteota archaeon]|nr:hypothetical protein [Thermoproteota archaeon]
MVDKISLVMLITVFTIFLFFNISPQQQQAKAFTPSNSPDTNNNIVNSPPDESSPGSFSSYVNDTFGITMQYPTNWEVSEQGVYPIPPDSTDDIVSFQNPASENASGPYVDVLTEKLDPVPSLTEYLNESIAAEKDLSGANILDSNTSATLAGHPAYIMVSSYTPGTEENASSFKKIETGTIVGNLAYVITYDVEDKDYAKYLPYVQKMIDSFKISSAPSDSDVSGNYTTFIQ